MGMRQNIELNYGDAGKIYLYSHWSGGDDINNSPLAQVLRKALARKQRWDDHSYLARIIVSELIREDIDSETGYGIAPYPIDEEYPTIVVDLENQTVNGTPYEKWITLYGV
jgi:hypothetical protein